MPETMATRPPYKSYATIMATFVGAAAANDFLQAAFTALTAKTNELELY